MIPVWLNFLFYFIVLFRDMSKIKICLPRPPSGEKYRKMSFSRTPQNDADWFGTETVLNFNLFFPVEFVLLFSFVIKTIIDFMQKMDASCIFFITIVIFFCLFLTNFKANSEETLIFE